MTLLHQAKKDGIYWEERKIIATGIGSPNPDAAPAAQHAGALRAARLLALRNAIELVKGIFINSSSTVENFMSTSGVVTTQVSGFVKGFQQSGRERYMSDGSVEVTMEIQLDGSGGITEMLLGSSLNNSPNTIAVSNEMNTDKIVFSGLIIDCKGLNVKPALSPRLLDENGKEIYGSANVQKEWAVKYGIVGYAKTIENAAKIDRVGQHPGTIKALKSSEKKQHRCHSFK